MNLHKNKFWCPFVHIWQNLNLNISNGQNLLQQKHDSEPDSVAQLEDFVA
jgi:hypothetical protein